jgi:hypothetical protein
VAGERVLRCKPRFRRRRRRRKHWRHRRGVEPDFARKRLRGRRIPQVGDRILEGRLIGPPRASRNLFRYRLCAPPQMGRLRPLTRIRGLCALTRQWQLAGRREL